MSVEKYIKENVKILGDKVFIAPDIPEKKINGAISGMAQGLNPDYVLAIVDTTIFGSAKEGCLFTGEYLYTNALGAGTDKIQLSTISKAEYICTEVKKIMEKSKKRRKLFFILKMEKARTLLIILEVFHMKSLQN
ncbi:hypothetical protein [Clostridium beijerinckii]|uniref:hypothetical protein n=1 Tax=Clostridium beijerinckii TaxID=1520 RepID=UPI0015702F4C|nr:hypothetical protein [Clostridium beijerinckii]NRY52588.1 putative nucleic acid-binding Zn ribbon protein [Clostridium beijerinckii]NSA90230.1 putative nucleic acid-binding Zn ribbon protein [Clostridium beijerinckii]